ncbi:hypothetical protein GCM10010252_22220 [Streptomyces aureoverticillatus]|nr:hypothetical protein GCM10010252_22220 [Streptomyces aureoverticillatus]
MGVGRMVKAIFDGISGRRANAWRRRPTAVAAVVLSGVLVTAGCGGSGDSPGDSGVSGDAASSVGAADGGGGTDVPGDGASTSSGSVNGGSTNGGSTDGGSSSSGSSSGGETWDGGGDGGSTWKPGQSTGGRTNGGSGGGGSTKPDPDKEFSWTPPGPDSPEWDGINTDHVYDLVQARNCSEAKRWYDNAGPTNWQANPAGWKVLEGMIAACFAVGGQEGEWRKVTAAYAAVRNQPSGDCKYVAARRTLGQLAEFRSAHPGGRVRIRPAARGSQACPSGITGVSATQATRGSKMWVKGTWPSEVTVYVGGHEARKVGNDDSVDPVCCHKAMVTFEVPPNVPTGTARILLRAGSVQLDAGTLDVTS